MKVWKDKDKNADVYTITTRENKYSFKSRKGEMRTNNSDELKACKN